MEPTIVRAGMLPAELQQQGLRMGATVNPGLRIKHSMGQSKITPLSRFWWFLARLAISPFLPITVLAHLLCTLLISSAFRISTIPSVKVGFVSAFPIASTLKDLPLDIMAIAMPTTSPRSALFSKRLSSSAQSFDSWLGWQDFSYGCYRNRL